MPPAAALRRSGLVLLGLWLALGIAAAARAEPIDLQTTRVALKPNDPGARRVGALAFRGGLVIQSSDPRFGGLSGLLVSTDGGTVLAVSDIAYWVRFRLDYRDGDLSGAHGAELWPMRRRDGTAMQFKQGDAESLAPLSPRGPDGDVAVGFERQARIWRYPFGAKAGDALPSVVPTPPEVKDLVSNYGLEGLARLPDGRLLAVAERTLDQAGNMVGWLLAGAKSAPLSYKRRDNFDLSDLCALPGGDVLALERKLVIPQGFLMRLRRIPAASIRAGALLDGSALATLDPNYTIDNMEGVAARRGRKGETLVYVISDDNYNRLERTILLMFALDPDSAKPTQPRPR